MALSGKSQRIYKTMDCSGGVKFVRPRVTRDVLGKYVATSKGSPAKSARLCSPLLQRIGRIGYEIKAIEVRQQARVSARQRSNRVWVV